MKFVKNNPPRRYNVGLDDKIQISDCGKIFLDNDEQITFIRKDGKEHDFAAKSWGFYATPSINGRLKTFGLKTALMKNSLNKYYVVIVDSNKMDEFEKYLSVEKQVLVEWLDEREE